MAGKTMIDAVSCNITEGKTLIDGVARTITGGKTMIDGVVKDIVFNTEAFTVTITGSMWNSNLGLYVGGISGEGVGGFVMDPGVFPNVPANTVLYVGVVTSSVYATIIFDGVTKFRGYVDGSVTYNYVVTADCTIRITQNGTSCTINVSKN